MSVDALDAAVSITAHTPPINNVAASLTRGRTAANENGERLAPTTLTGDDCG